MYRLNDVYQTVQQAIDKCGTFFNFHLPLTSCFNMYMLLQIK